MDYLDKKKRNFKIFISDSNALYLLISNLLFGVLLSLIPAGSLTTFLLFMLITLLEMGLTWVWWKKDMEMIRYNSLTAFLLLMTMGVFAVTPLFRVMNGTFLFWSVLAIYLIVLLYSLVKKEIIFQAFDKPGKSKIAKGTVIFVLVLLILGAFSFRYGQEMVIMASLNDQQGALYVSAFAYVIGLLMTFVSTSLLKKSKEIR